MDYKGCLRISIRNASDKIFVNFTDTGGGISKELQSKIFEPFYSTKPKGEGSGLGLDICKKIIDKHNGEIELSSEESGTTFTIILPKK